MYNTKSTMTLIVFSLLWLFITFISVGEDVEGLGEKNLKEVTSVEVTSFIDVLYFQIKNNNPSLKLDSSHLQIRGESDLSFKSPKGLLITDLRKIAYSADFGEIGKKVNIFRLSGDVSFSDKNSTYLSDKIIYEGNQDKLTAIGNVSSELSDEKSGDKIKIRSRKLTSILKEKILSLSGSVRGNITRKRLFEQGMKFEAENVDVNSVKSQINLSNSVKIQRNNFNLSAGTAEIFLENYNKKLKYYTLYDDVKLEEKMQLETGQKQLRKAYAEKLVGYQRSGKIVLSGAPRVEQGKDVIKGYQVILRENTELVEVDDSKSSFNLKRKQ